MTNAQIRTISWNILFYTNDHILLMLCLLFTHRLRPNLNIEFELVGFCSNQLPFNTCAPKTLLEDGRHHNTSTQVLHKSPKNWYLRHPSNSNGCATVAGPLRQSCWWWAPTVRRSSPTLQLNRPWPTGRPVGGAYFRRNFPKLNHAPLVMNRRIGIL